MTETVLNFPARNVAALRCVWRATGNPSQPLVCKWVLRQSGDAVSPEFSSRQHFCKLCA